MSDELERMLRLQVSMEMGIVPLLGADDVNRDVLRALREMSPEESRTFRRKFRKAWRKEARAAARLLKNKKPGAAGFGMPVPDKRAKKERKWLVMMAIIHEVRSRRMAVEGHDPVSEIPLL
ncbi:MAG: hypothetical protein EBU83_04490 [bacterium]|nr:hypothetical protein [Candidatus Aquidulcis sp.]